VNLCSHLLQSKLFEKQTKYLFEKQTSQGLQMMCCY